MSSRYGAVRAERRKKGWRVFRAIARLLFENPTGRALGLGLLGLLGNVLAGVYVFDITKTGADGKPFLDWSVSLQSFGLWSLVAVLVVGGFYAWGVARFERRATEERARQAEAQKAYTRGILTQAEIDQQALRAVLPSHFANLRRKVESGDLETLADVLRMVRLEAEMHDDPPVHPASRGSDASDAGERAGGSVAPAADRKDSSGGGGS